ncbi:Uncharacterized protein GBIM_11037 [Gryllus bimaculatus]|nr:Uncharacterized protein GBIM_11037 [Gryllus bimaculatus]
MASLNSRSVTKRFQPLLPEEEASVELENRLQRPALYKRLAPGRSPVATFGLARAPTEAQQRAAGRVAGAEGGECAAEWAEEEEEEAGPEEGPVWRGAWAPLLEDLATQPGGRARAAADDDQPQTPRQVSETDIYLLDAIEKLTYRIDFLDKRLRRVEAMLYHLTAAQDSAPQGTSSSEATAAPAPATTKPEAAAVAAAADPGACGGGAGGEWRRVGRLPSCYRFARDAVDWKAAAASCRAQGAALLELEDARETKALLAHLRATQHLRGTAFWTGGLNPGLLWLWAGSGRPVAANASAAAAHGVGAQDGVRGAGRCLQLAPVPGVAFEYRGVDSAMARCGRAEDGGDEDGGDEKDEDEGDEEDEDAGDEDGDDEDGVDEVVEDGKDEDGGDDDGGVEDGVDDGENEDGDDEDGEDED